MAIVFMANVVFMLVVMLAFKRVIGEVIGVAGPACAIVGEVVVCAKRDGLISKIVVLKQRL